MHYSVAHCAQLLRRRYNEASWYELENFTREEVTAAVEAAVAQAVEETLKAGVPIFYYDWDLGIDIMQQPDGRRFEIRYIPGAPGDENHEIVREMKAAA